MYTPAFLLVCLEQKDRSLEAHLDNFLFLAPSTHFPDSSLCNFLYAGLNTATKVLLSGEGPPGSFRDYVEWVLASCGSSMNVDISDDASPTPTPVHSHQHPDCKDRQHEPTADREEDFAATFEPAPTRATEQDIATEPEQRGTDQVCEPAVPSVAEGILVEYEGMEVSPTQPPATESEFLVNSGDIFSDLEEVNMQPVVLQSLAPPSLPLPPPLQKIFGTLSFSELFSTLQTPLSSATPAIQSSLSPISPSVSPSPLSGRVPPRDCWEPPHPGREEPGVPPPASELFTPPRPVDLAPTPTLLPPSSSASTIGHSVSLGSLGTSALPGSDIATPLQRTYGPVAALWPSTPSATASSALPQAPPPPSVAPAPPLPSGYPLPPRGVIAAAPSRSPRSSGSLRVFGVPAAWWAPTLSSPLPIVPMVAYRTTSPRLLPSTTPPWAAVLAVYWMVLLLPLFKASLWTPSPASPWTPAPRLLPGNRPPPEPPPTPSQPSHLRLPLSATRGRAFSGRGRYVTCTLCSGLFWTCCCSISHHQLVTIAITSSSHPAVPYHPA
ncbi:hypothetical protein DPX16_4710 [Anabarilius grahami]|uniref:Uncharacterized protein n=1 Tax=Anabarilius grahami TaxID=495550 RepID=A0A3N0YGJ9_ANAGA|nr:hypothetical protein DPX16_4710 [Anabarilius grahami]